MQPRELGINDVSNISNVTVDGISFTLGHKDAMYVEMGSRDVIFNSEDAKNHTKFYLNSAPVHTSYLTKKVSLGEANKLELGSEETANQRTVSQMIIW